MKKLLLPLFILFLLVGNVVALNTASPESIYSDGNFEVLDSKSLSSMFTIATSSTKTLRVGDSTIIASDETANGVCDSANLQLQINNPDGSKTTRNVVSGVPVVKGKILSYAVRWYPKLVGKFLFEAKILCGSQVISKTSSLEVIVEESGSICTQGYTGSNYCDDTTNSVLRRYNTCPNNIISNKVVDDCDAKGLSCLNGACVKLTEENQLCKSGEVVNTYCYKENVIGYDVCSSSGLTTKFDSTTCPQGQLCSDGKCLAEGSLPVDVVGETCVKKDKTVNLFRLIKIKYSSYLECNSVETVKGLTEEQLKTAPVSTLKDYVCGHTTVTESMVDGTPKRTTTTHSCVVDSTCTALDQLPDDTRTRIASQSKDPPLVILGKWLVGISVKDPAVGICVVKGDSSSKFDFCKITEPLSFGADFLGDKCSTGGLFLVIGIFILILLFKK